MGLLLARRFNLTRTQLFGFRNERDKSHSIVIQVKVVNNRLSITNMKFVYMKPEILSPVSSSDHNCVLWSPKAQSTSPQCTKRELRAIREPALSKFGTWITNHPWLEVNEAASIYNTILPEINKTFPYEDSENLSEVFLS